MAKKIDKQEIKTDLTYKTKNVWETIEDKTDVFKFCEDYKTALDIGKTEREFVKYAVNIAKEQGFTNIDEIIAKDKKLKPGMKVYKTIHKKACIFAVVGEDGLENGTNIVGAHIDAPRIDVKQNPLYEDSAMALFKTHYYGGIKKYQWVAIPLAIHGSIVKEDGQVIDVCIGEDETDPVFTISDLLPHLGAEQMVKKASEVIAGEDLNLLIGSIPKDDKDTKEKIKQNILEMLNKKYGIIEEDFASSELEIVPAFKARDVGIDRGMVGGYGQDDRVCAYTSLKALMDIKSPKRTCICILTDKEEIGSVGNTGAQSKMLRNFLNSLCWLEKNERPMDFVVSNSLSNSKMLSADVGAGFDPTFPAVHEKKNAAIMGHGLIIQKFTGSRGKSGASDANAEFVAEVRRIFNQNNIIWQTAELGKVDQGGGGTIAMFVANEGAQVLDCGVALLSMHSPFEIACKSDIYMAYKGYKAFLESAE